MKSPNLIINNKKIEIAPATVLFQTDISSYAMKLSYFFDNIKNLITYEQVSTDAKSQKALIRGAFDRLFDNAPISVTGDVGWDDGEKTFLIDLEKFTPN